MHLQMSNELNKTVYQFLENLKTEKNESTKNKMFAILSLEKEMNFREMRKLHISWHCGNFSWYIIAQCDNKNSEVVFLSSYSTRYKGQ